MFIAPLFIIAKSQINPNVHQWADKWINKTQYIHTMEYSCFTFFYFLADGGLTSGLCTGKAGALPLEPYLQSNRVEYSSVIKRNDVLINITT
jgi:hypothetical protein